MRDWKWFGELSDEEKAIAREQLKKHSHLRGQKLAFSKNGRLMYYDRPPTQLHYWEDENGELDARMKEMMETGECVDTHDGGFLMLVEVGP